MLSDMTISGQSQDLTHFGNYNQNKSVIAHFKINFLETNLNNLPREQMEMLFFC